MVDTHVDKQLPGSNMSCISIPPREQYPLPVPPSIHSWQDNSLLNCPQFIEGLSDSSVPVTLEVSQKQSLSSIVYKQSFIGHTHEEPLSLLRAHGITPPLSKQLTSYPSLLIYKLLPLFVDGCGILCCSQPITVYSQDDGQDDATPGVKPLQSSPEPSESTHVSITEHSLKV